MKRILFAALLGAAVVVLGYGGMARAGETGPIKIGIFQPLTGPATILGTDGRDGAALAVKQINAAGGVLGRKLELLSYDDQSSPEVALKVVVKMLEVDKVDAIIGSLHSGNIQAAGRRIEAAKTVCVGTGTSPVWLQQGWTYLFRSSINTYDNTMAILDAVASLKFKTLGIIHSQDEYGQVGLENMLELAEKGGMKVVATESFKPGDTDLTAQMTNIRAAKPDVVYIIAVGNELGPILKQLRNAGYFGHTMGEMSFASPELQEIAGKATDKAIFATLYLVPLKSPDEIYEPLVKKFLIDFRDEFGRMLISEVGYRCYDAVYVIAEGIKRAGSTDGTAMRDAIRKINDFEGLAGKFDYTDGSGEGLRTCRIYVIMDSKKLPLAEYLKTLEKK